MRCCYCMFYWGFHMLIYYFDLLCLSYSFHLGPMGQWAGPRAGGQGGARRGGRAYSGGPNNRRRGLAYP